MKFRGQSPRRTIELQMTPMIDIVFQLLVFFIMTFTIAQLEGDFRVTLPAAPRMGPLDDSPALPLIVRLAAAPDGSLAAIELAGQPLADMAALRRHVIALVERDAATGTPAAFEAHIASDEQLHYQHVIETLTAVSGYKNPQGEIVPLIESIRFAPTAGQ